MKPFPFGEWLLAVLLVCVAVAYWYIALALAVSAALAAYAYSRLVARAHRELDAEETLYLPESWNDEAPAARAG